MGENNNYEVKNSASFPSPLDSFEKKLDKYFGLSLGQAISAEWFSTAGGGRCRFYTSQADFYNRRNYASGLVDMSKYHQKLGTNGDVSLLNLSKKPLTRLPKLVNLLVNGMCDRGYTIKANAIDPISQANKQKYRQQIKDDMNSKEIIDLSKEKFGIDIGTMPTDKLPENDEELNLHLDLEWKPSCELSAQMAIQAIFMENMYNMTIERQGIRDLVVDGAFCAMNKFNPAKGIELKRIDFADMIYSQTSDPYFRDCFYKGHIAKVLTSDILIEYPDLNNPENENVKEQLVNQGSWWSRQYSLADKIKGHTYLLYFTYKTTKEDYNKIKSKGTGEKVYSKAKDDFDETKETSKKDKFKRVSKVEEVLFEGCMVLGTNIMLKWEVARSMARPNSNKQKVCEQYNMIAPNFENGIITSPVSLAMPIEDMLNLVELKAEQILQRINPDGVAINLDAIAGVELGDGKPYGAKEAFEMWLQSGSYFYRGDTLTGEYNNNQKPFQEIQTGDSLGKLTALRNENKEYSNQLLDVIGLNQFSDASTPDKDSLVGIGKLASLNSNTTTRHILSGAGYIAIQTAEATLYRVQDILRYYPSLKTDFIRKIGATAVEDLESIANLHLSDFALNLYFEPDLEERAKLEADLSEASSAGLITYADKYKVLNIKIHDLAIAYLALVIEKASKKKEEMDANKFKMQADENIRASQEAEKAKQETISIELQAKTQQANLEGDWAIKKEQEKGNQARLTEEIKGTNAINLQQVTNEGKVDVANKTETAKKENILEQGNIHSQITDQRAKDKDPIDFKAQNEEMSVFEAKE